MINNLFILITRCCTRICSSLLFASKGALGATVTHAESESNIIHELMLFMHINKSEADFISVLSSGPSGTLSSGLPQRP